MRLKLRAIRIIRDDSAQPIAGLEQVERDEMIRHIAERITEAQGFSTPELVSECEARLRSVILSSDSTKDVLAKVSQQLLWNASASQLHHEIDIHRVMELLAD